METRHVGGGWHFGSPSRRGGIDVDVGDIPFELVGEVSSSGSVAEASDVESGTAAGHLGCCSKLGVSPASFFGLCSRDTISVYRDRKESSVR